MSTETPRTEQQHWAEAVAEHVTDEQEALRLVGLYEDGEWQPEMLAIGRENLALKRDLTAARARVAELEAGLLALANAADDVGVKHLDTDDMSDEVLALRGRTDLARALLSPSPEPRT